MRALFGIAAMQKLSASPMQAPRSSAVGLLTLAAATVGSRLSSKPATPNSPMRILIMTVSLGRKLRHLTPTTSVVPPRFEENCDGHHTFALLLLCAFAPFACLPRPQLPGRHRASL